MVEGQAKWTVAGMDDLEGLLERGVAYHHSGMLPILREFVELCFQQKLVRLVFATETLAVGVNMPARSVAFSQLDKPDDTGARPRRSRHVTPRRPPRISSRRRQAGPPLAQS